MPSCAHILSKFLVLFREVQPYRNLYIRRRFGFLFEEMRWLVIFLKKIFCVSISLKA